MIQHLLIAPIGAWAAWYVFGTVAPWRQRRLRAWLARLGAPVLPAAVLAWLRPGMPATHCGCGSACTSVAQAPKTLGPHRPPK